MSNADLPATPSVRDEEGATGATATGAAGKNRLGELPERVRVHALAKLLGSSSREVLGKLGELGEAARSPQSSVPRAVALRVAEMYEAAETVVPGQDSAEAAPAQLSLEQEQSHEPAPAAERESGSAHVPVFAAPSPVFLPPEPSAEPAPQDGAGSQDEQQDEQQDAAGQGRPGKAGSGKAGSGKAGGGKSGASKSAASKESASKESSSKGSGSRRAGNKGAGSARSAGDGSPDGGAAVAETQRKDASEAEKGSETDSDGAAGPDTAAASEQADDGSDDASRRRRRRGRRGRGRGRGADDDAGTDVDAGTPGPDKAGQDKPGQDKAGQDKAQRTEQDQGAGKSAGKPASGGKKDAAADSADGGQADGESKRRRRRRRKGGGDEPSNGDDPPNTVVHVREESGAGRDSDSDGVRSVRGSTRLEAKRQRRRDGKEAGRRRAPILSEAEFLARRESVERKMVVGDKHGSTQIGVLEDDVLVEHFVTSAGSGSIVGNVYLGRVQNVLPSMEAAFIDIGRGRNAVLYAGEVDWDSAGLEGKARKIEQALTSGDHVLVQVTKDPVGHKGARLTTQISLPGRFLVYVPSGGTTGISRKLPENERRRLKDILKRVVPEDAGVIIRTASEGISEQELDRDVQRLREQWESIKQRSAATSNAGQSKKSGAPALLYEEPDLLIKVVRDLFTEDFVKMEIQGEHAWDTIHGYVQRVAPELTERLKRYVGTGDVFAENRIDEQISKALDRKVWLPSGGYLVIDRTEAMTVIDVNTGKFTGSGGNLEETVTRNNLESAEEIVRQLRLRDIGGIVVIDFIDMVLESNRELVLRRLTECLGRDRTRHQVAEVTSLGLVQMTRKRIGTGLLESFSTSCEHCKGRGLHISTEPTHGGNGGGQQSGSRKHRGKADKAGASSEAADPAISTGPTQHQRESAANAVAAMASASKIATSKLKGEDGDPGEAATEDQRQEPAPAQATEAASATRAGTAERTGDTGATTTEAAGEAESEPAAPRPTGRRARRAVSRPAGPPA